MSSVLIKKNYVGLFSPTKCNCWCYILYKRLLSLSFWNYTYKDKRDGQKHHFALKTYGGQKTIDFRDIEGI